MKLTNGVFVLIVFKKESNFLIFSSFYCHFDVLISLFH